MLILRKRNLLLAALLLATSAFTQNAAADEYAARDAAADSIASQGTTREVRWSQSTGGDVRLSQAAALNERPPQDTLTAAALASQVIAANPGLAAALSAAEAAAYRVEPAGALNDPMLSYGVAPLTASADRSLNQRVDVSQSFPWPGTLAARKEAARLDARAASGTAETLKLQLIANAKSAHAEWRFVADALRIHHDTRGVLDELLAVAEARYAAGRASKQDVLQAEVERARLDNHELQLRRQQLSVRARINALLNKPSAAILPAATPMPASATAPPLPRLQELAIAQHPELDSLRARIDASDSRVTLAEKAFLPDFQLGVGYNSLWDGVDKRPVVGVSINVPIYRGKRRADLDRAKAEKRRAQYSLSEQRANLLAELAAVHAQLVESQQSVDLYERRLLPLADEYVGAAVADYQSGSGEFLNVISAAQHKLASELALVRVRADVQRNFAELERWTGASLSPLPYGAEQ